MSSHQMSEQPSLWRSILAQRCPRCREGQLFRTATIMHERCPVCGLQLRREPGYYLGALYLSYGMAVLVLGTMMAVSLCLFPEIHSLWLATIAAVLFLPLAPAIHRYSRILWIYFDRWGSPEGPGGPGN